MGFGSVGNVWAVGDEQVKYAANPPAGTYLVQNTMKGYILVAAPDMVVPEKVYQSPHLRVNRIFETFKHRANTTGVLLAGEKGSGKTLLAKMLAKEAIARGFPVLLVNQPFVGDAFNSFLEAFTVPVVLILDEFEKVFNDENQSALLTLLDGTCPGKRMFVLTCNEMGKVSRHFLNRPGRIWYKIEYTGLDDEFVKEYALDQLKNQDHLPGLIAATGFLSPMNFDMLQCLVTEMNTFDVGAGLALKDLNVTPSDIYASFDVKYYWKGVELPEKYNQQYNMNPLHGLDKRACVAYLNFPKSEEFHALTTDILAETGGSGLQPVFAQDEEGEYTEEVKSYSTQAAVKSSYLLKADTDGALTYKVSLNGGKEDAPFTAVFTKSAKKPTYDPFMQF